MEDKQGTESEERFSKIESDHKTVKICLYIILVWFFLGPICMGLLQAVFIEAYFLSKVYGVVAMVIVLAVLSVAVFWSLRRYQDWKRGKEEEGKGRIERDFTESLKTPSGDSVG